MNAGYDAVCAIYRILSQGATCRCCCGRDRSSRIGWSDESGSIRNANEWASFDDGLSTILSEIRQHVRIIPTQVEKAEGTNYKQHSPGYYADYMRRVLHTMSLNRARFFFPVGRQSPEQSRVTGIIFSKTNCPFARADIRYI